MHFSIPDLEVFTKDKSNFTVSQQYKIAYFSDNRAL